MYYDNTFTTARSRVNLDIGANHLFIKVTAEDGITEMFYNVTVTRQPGYYSGGDSISTPQPTPHPTPPNNKDSKTTNLGGGNRLDTPPGQDPIENEDGSITLPG